MYRKSLESLAHVDPVAARGGECEIGKCAFYGVCCRSFPDVQRFFENKLFFECAACNFLENANDFELGKCLRPAELEHGISCGGVR